ncbi:MAG: protein kinase domain-containing protein [Nannocystaceae bacterium]|nr:serine/threonine protein kinase [bacterium]
MTTESGTLSCAEASPRHAGDTPRTIGRYAVEARVGAGGMGVVWAAHDPELDRRVAVKVLRPGTGTEAGRRGQIRLVREAQAMARLSHPNVVQVYDAGVDDEKVYVAMEFVEGMTAARWLEDESRSWREVVRLFAEAGRGLAAAHEAGLVHRDFKPSNVLVGEDGRVRVADFGLASTAASHEVDAALAQGATTVSTELTSRGSMVGTPRYMAPEQRRGDVAGPAADQFSFCVALHEALYGERPYPSASKKRRRLEESDYRPPQSTIGLPRVVVEAVRRGLRVDPDDRFPSMDALLERIADAPDLLRRRLQRAVFASVALGASVVGWSVAAAGPGCDASEDAIVQVWDETRQEHVASLLGQASPAVMRTLDAYAERWVEAGRATCEAHDDGLLSEPLMAASVTCLEDRRHALDRYLTLVEEGEPGVRANAAIAANRLPRVGDCRDTRALQAGLTTGDEALAEAVDDLRRRTLLATVSHHAGRVEAALAELEGIEWEAAASEHAPIIAEVGLAVGRLAMDRQDWMTAQARLEDASRLGIASARDLVAAEAEARLIFVAAMHEGPSQGLRHERVADGLAKRVGDPPALRALIANNVGVGYGISGDRTRAAEAFQRAFDLSSGGTRVDLLDRTGYALNVALLTSEPEARDALFRRSADELEQALGRGHYQWVDHMAAWAFHTADPDLALERLEPLCPQLVGRAEDDPMRAYRCFARVALLHELREESREALSASRMAAEALEGISEPPLKAFRLMAEARVAQLEGKTDPVIRQVDEALSLLEPAGELPWARAARAELALIRTLAVEHADAESLRASIATFDAQREGTEDQQPVLLARRARALLAELERP